MKKRKLIIMVTLLLMAGSANAQGQFPIVYYTLGDLGFEQGYDYIWDEIIKGEPGQCLGLIAPGAKKITSTIIKDEYPDEPTKLEHELYPNGLMKCSKQGSGFTFTYNYDNQWRLQNIIRDQGNNNISTYKYMYEKQHRLAKCIYSGGVDDEYVYNYDNNDNLLKIVKNNYNSFYFKNSQLTQIGENSSESSLMFIYDENGRYKGYTKIMPDYDECTYKTQLTYTYSGTSPFPSSITKRWGEYSPSRKNYVGTSYSIKYQSTFTFDSKGNWTKWRVKKVAGNGIDYDSYTITRTITYYTDEEVKTALAELEKARNGSLQNDQKKEDLWEY